MDTKLGNLNLYDQIVSAVVANAFAEATRTDNQIYLKWFDSTIPAHNVYYEGASIAATVLNCKIYVDTSFSKYLKLKLKNWKRRKQLKWIAPDSVPSNATRIQPIIDHISAHFELGDEAKSIWADLNYRYYTKKKGATDESSNN